MTPAALPGLSSSDAWLCTVAGMPPLDGPAGTAERLLLHMLYGIDWQLGWVARYRSTYRAPRRRPISVRLSCSLSAPRVASVRSASVAGGSPPTGTPAWGL